MQTTSRRIKCIRYSLTLSFWYCSTSGRHSQVLSKLKEKRELIESESVNELFILILLQSNVRLQNTTDLSILVQTLRIYQFAETLSHRYSINLLNAQIRTKFS